VLAKKVLAKKVLAKKVLAKTVLAKTVLVKTVLVKKPAKRRLGRRMEIRGRRTDPKIQVPGMERVPVEKMEVIQATRRANPRRDELVARRVQVSIAVGKPLMVAVDL
jgi:hypothetical protein